MKWLCSCMWHCWCENQHFQIWGILSFEEYYPTFSSSWRSIIEAGREAQVSWGRIHGEEKQHKKLHVRSGKASAVMRALHRSVVLKRELSRKVKLSGFKSIFVPILTYGRGFWVMIERVRSQIQASEVRVLRIIKGGTMFDKLRNTLIWEFLDIEPLLFRIEKSQLRWLIIQAECLRNGFKLFWCIEKCSGLIWCCCPRKPQEKAGEEKRRIWSQNKIQALYSLKLSWSARCKTIKKSLKNIEISAKKIKETEYSMLSYQSKR